MSKVHSNIIKLLLLAVGHVAVFGACSPESTGLIGQGYHNTTARYNAYFLAREKLQEVEAQIKKSHQRNFNQLLYIYPPLDTLMAKQYAEPLQQAMKMASLSIERHKNSKWADDSYLLVGQARYYGREMEHAVETFKYVNTKSKDDPTRQKALIYLMRTFIDEGELNNAKGVADYLRKEKLNKENERDYHLAVSMLYRQRQEWDQVATHLEKAVENTKKGINRATYRFMLGQLYQQAGNEEAAYENFRQVLRNNPDYELSFYARLHMAQVAKLGQDGDEKKIRKYFSKLLRDRKNKEYRDKIYYELGNFELRQGNLDAALENYRLSIRASIKNERQKSFAYRKLAELHYDAGKYRLSKAYYDSTASSTPQDEKDYTLLQEKQKVMANLVSQLDVIEQKDSLLRLASMDKTVLEAYLDEVVRREEQERALAARKNREKAALANMPTGFSNTNDKFGVAQEQAGGTWYFYNPSMVSIGQAEFVKRWGNRALEDNWRRAASRRTATNTANQDPAQEAAAEAASAEINTEERLAARRKQLYESLPLAPAQQAETRRQVEIAFYNLGNIFNHDLKEFNPSVEAYVGLLDRFSDSEYRPEVLYKLYLLYLNDDGAKAAKYKEELISRHPQSTYAKSLINPDFEREEDRINNQVKELYARAYKLYQRQAYTRADSLLEAGLQQYPKNPFRNRLDLLQIMILGQTEGVERYQQELNRFIKENEKGELQQYATELLQASYKFAENTAVPQGPLFNENFDQPHYFIVVFNQDKKQAGNLLKVLDSYNSQKEGPRKLKATTIVLTDKKSMAFVSQFPDKTAAMLYFRALERNNLFSEELKNAVSEYFVISKDNFTILYNSKDVGKYISFFQKFYY